MPLTRIKQHFPLPTYLVSNKNGEWYRRRTETNHKTMVCRMVIKNDYLGCENAVLLAIYCIDEIWGKGEEKKKKNENEKKQKTDESALKTAFSRAELGGPTGRQGVRARYLTRNNTSLIAPKRTELDQSFFLKYFFGWSEDQSCSTEEQLTKKWLELTSNLSHALHVYKHSSLWRRRKHPPNTDLPNGSTTAALLASLYGATSQHGTPTLVFRTQISIDVVKYNLRNVSPNTF